LFCCNPEPWENPTIGATFLTQNVVLSSSPLYLVPTTAGTGSETTGTAIFDYKPLNVKTGIASRKLRPTLGIVDPLNTLTMPKQVKIASGLDVLCHALESYTALPYNERSPRPSNPAERPAYQGSNPISDIWSLEALRLTVKYLSRSANDPTDKEANTEMCLAASAAGTGFGSAGVHVSCNCVTISGVWGKRMMQQK
jgi:hydroxyacid-oxoacid transhydrogenase